MAFVVLYDACVLYPAPLRDLLIRIANTGIVRARWTDAILDECFRSILKRPDLTPEALKRTRDLMKPPAREAARGDEARSYPRVTGGALEQTGGRSRMTCRFGGVTERLDLGGLVAARLERARLVELVEAGLPAA